MTSPAWRRFLGCYSESRLVLAAAVAASLLAALLSIPIVLLVRYVFDHVLPSHDYRALLLCALALGGASIAGNAVTLWISTTTLTTTKKVIFVLRTQLLEHLYELPRSFFDESDRMRLHSVIVQDTERLDVMSNALVAQVLPAVAVSAALALVLLTVNWELVVTMFALAPVLFLANHLLRTRFQKHVNRFRQSFEDFSKGTLFVMQALDLTVLRSAQRLELEQQTRLLEELRATSTSVAWFDAVYNITQNMLATFSSLLVLMVGGALVMKGEMSVGQLLSFYVTARILGAQTQTIVTNMPKIFAGMESLRGIDELLSRDEAAPYAGTRRVGFDGSVALSRSLLKNRPTIVHELLERLD